MSKINYNLQTSIDELDRAASRGGLRFSAQKTYCIEFTRLRTPHDKPNISLRGHRIKVEDKARFLGVIFDKTLNWKAHIEDLVTKCRQSLNILRCMANINWGSDRETLLELYRSLILTKLEYGAVVYGSARKTTLANLDTIHYCGLRMACGAFRTSPNSSIYCEVGLPPLSIRRVEQEMRYATNLRAKSKHLNYKIFTGPILRKSNMAQPTATRPLSIRVMEHLDKNNRKFFKVSQYGFNKFPSWLISNAVCCTELTKYKKNDTSPIMYASRFLCIKDNYQNATTMYTDGSKSEVGVGCAAVTSNSKRTWRLPHSTSIYTAELYAIHKALELVLKCPTKNRITIVCSDSLSARNTLKQKFSYDPLIQLIFNNLWRLQQNKQQVIFMWTSGHIRITGNNKADKVAKEAASASNSTYERVRPADLIYEIRDISRAIWQRHWSNGESKLKKIKPLIEKLEMPRLLSRSETVALTRLRID